MQQVSTDCMSLTHPFLYGFWCIFLAWQGIQPVSLVPTAPVPVAWLGFTSQPPSRSFDSRVAISRRRSLTSRPYVPEPPTSVFPDPAQAGLHRSAAEPLLFGRRTMFSCGHMFLSSRHSVCYCGEMLVAVCPGVHLGATPCSRMKF